MKALLRLLARQVCSDRGVAALLALVVLATVGLTTAALRLTDRAAADDVRAAVTALDPARRDATGVLDMPPDPRLPELLPGALDEAAAQLGDLAGRPVWALRTGPFTAPGAPGTENVFTVRLGSGWQDRVRLAEGSLPRGAKEAPPIRPQPADENVRPLVVLDVALTRAAAKAMSVRLGELVDVTPSSVYAGSDLRLRLVGLLDPLDPADPFWADEQRALRALVTFRDPRATIEATAFAGTGALDVLSRDVYTGPRLGLRVPLVPSAVAARPPEQVVDALRRLNTRLVPVTEEAGGIRLASGLTPVLEGETARRRPLRAVTAVLVAVLLAAALGALLLAARLLVHRRRTALALARARGASTRQVLGVLAAEGLLLGVPPAVLAVVLARLVPAGAVRDTPGGWRLLLAVAVALTPAVALAAAAARLVGDGGRPGGAARRLAARHGWTAAIVLLVAAAALSALALRSRGLEPAAGGPAGAEGDVVVVVAPVLVAAAVAVLVARVVGPLLGLVVTLLTRLRGGVVFLGTARAARERSAAGVALVALALTVAAGLLSATTAATVRDGTVGAAAGATGADLRVAGLGFTDAEEAALARVAGLTDVAAWADPQNAGIAGSNGVTTQTTVIATQPERLAAVQRDLPLVEPFPAAAAQRLATAVRAGGNRVPVAVSAGLAPVGAGLDLRVAGRPVPATVVATVPPFPSAPDGPFVVADLAQLRQRTGLVLAPQYLLARVAGAVPDEARLRAAVPSLSGTSSWEQTAQRATSSPMVRAVRAGLPTALAVGAALAALTAVLALLLGARERGRFLAHLRALGLSARQSAALVALEALPTGLGGLVAGLVAGLGLTWLVLPAADLRPLTGAAQPPAVVASAVTVLGVAGAFVVVVAFAVAVAVVAGRSVSPVEAARTVEAE